MPIKFGDDKPPGDSTNVGRKRRRPTPGFGIPPPFSPITGTHATLRVEGIHPYCAMMQVAAEDTHEDYVICRGFDPRSLKFVDYAAGDPEKPGISVAKPFGNRTVGAYTVAEVYPAFLPTQGVVGEGKAESHVPPSPTDVDWRVGQNPGTAPTSNPGGQPTALVDTIEAMTDDSGVLVQWMLISGGGGGEVLWGEAKENWTDNGADCHHVIVHPCDDCEGANADTATEHTVLLPSTAEQDPNVIAGDVIAYEVSIDGAYVCSSDYLDDKIATVKMWVGAKAAIAPGWAIMDGIANTAGSGLTMIDKFARGSDLAQTGGGFEEHTHLITDFEIEPHTIEDLKHNHSVLDTPGDLVTPSVVPGDPQIPTIPACTEEPSGPFLGEVNGSSCAEYSWGPLNHEFTNPYVDQTEHLPPYQELLFIERMDNSVP